MAPWHYLIISNSRSPAPRRPDRDPAGWSATCARGLELELYDGAPHWSCASDRASPSSLLFGAWAEAEAADAERKHHAALVRRVSGPVLVRKHAHGDGAEPESNPNPSALPGHGSSHGGCAGWGRRTSSSYATSSSSTLRLARGCGEQGRRREVGGVGAVLVGCCWVVFVGAETRTAEREVEFLRS
jgi:hypothetical protein